jgi:hypothetical protein
MAKVPVPTAPHPIGCTGLKCMSFSQDWARVDAGRKAEVRLHSGMQREALPRRCSQSPNRQDDMARRGPKEQFLVPRSPLQYKLVTETYRNARRVRISFDNYGIHYSQQVQLALKSAAASRIQLHFLPQNCPDHNRIERLRKNLHDNVTRNHRCAGAEEPISEMRLYVNAQIQCGRRTYAQASAA